MAFNELNSVEHFIIHNLTGVNLNEVRAHRVKEDTESYGAAKWKYVQSELLAREITDVFVEKELKAALSACAKLNWHQPFVKVTE